MSIVHVCLTTPLSCWLHLFCVSWAFVLVTCAPAEKPIAIVSQSSEIEPDGSYSWSYETANGIAALEAGAVKKSADPKGEDVLVVIGSFSYTSPDGVEYTVGYLADEDGFVPEGDHIPTPPPIPPEIQRALDYIASHPSPS